MRVYDFAEALRQPAGPAADLPPEPQGQNADVNTPEKLFGRLFEVLENPLQYATDRVGEPPLSVDKHERLQILRETEEQGRKQWFALDEEGRICHQLALLDNWKLNVASYSGHTFARIYDVIAAAVSTKLNNLVKQNGGSWRLAGVSWRPRTRVRKIAVGEAGGDVGMIELAAKSPNFKAKDHQTVRRNKTRYESIEIELAFVETTGERPIDYLWNAHGRSGGRGHRFAETKGKLDAMPPEWKKRRNRAKEVIEKTQDILARADAARAAPKKAVAT